MKKKKKLRSPEPPQLRLNRIQLGKSVTEQTIPDKTKYSRKNKYKKDHHDRNNYDGFFMPWNVCVDINSPIDGIVLNKASSISS